MVLYPTIGLLKEVMIPRTAAKLPNCWILQQDNAHSHVAKDTENLSAQKFKF